MNRDARTSQQKPFAFCRAGFSLIELLVVIAIIAILVALLLPVLSRSKNHGAKVTDLNNLHQTMIALRLYADDYNGSLTWPN